MTDIILKSAACILTMDDDRRELAGADIRIRDGVIADGADIGARCELLRGARVWPGVFIPDCGIRYSSDV